MTSVINTILSDNFLGFFLLKLWKGFFAKQFRQDSNCMFEPSLIVDHIIFILGWLPISSGVELHCGIIGTTLSSLSPDFRKAPQSWLWIFFSQISSFDLFGECKPLVYVSESWLYVFLWSFPWFPFLRFLTVCCCRCCLTEILRFGTTGYCPVGTWPRQGLPIKTQHSALSHQYLAQQSIWSRSSQKLQKFT